ncbi:MAG: 2OG-Fe(II) oxygenase family protein [Gammaproteobacteria bacterium]|nr:2OG-Fe(II) oxygenase family protein [Gammaproteobacteria bacterium]
MIKTIDFNDPNAPTLLVSSFRETGFAIINLPPVDFNLLQQCFAAWRGFFKNPDTDYVYDSESGAGWIDQSLSEKAKDAQKKDLKEFYHYYKGQPCPENIKQVTDDSFNMLFNLSSTLLKWVEQALPNEIKAHFDRPLSDMVSTKNTLFRIIHYPPLNDCEDTDGIRAAAHEDINLITILPPGTAEGLQVKTIDGQWYPVDAKSNQVVVNIGDMLQELTRKYLISTCHRVINPIDLTVPRYAMPLFLHPHDDVKLSDQYPRANDYLKERLRELGLLKEAEPA